MNCEFCNTQVKNKASKVQHEIRCKLNPNRREDLVRLFKGFRQRIPWNKNKKLSVEHREKLKTLALSNPNQGKCSDPYLEKIRIDKIKSTISKNKRNGGLRLGSGRGVKTWYESPIAGRVYLRSSYELIFAKWLDSNLINWKANSECFNYRYNDKNFKYYPDFYLIDTDEYIEIKGFKTDRDISKWRDFPHKLRIMYREDLINLDSDRMDEGLVLKTSKSI